MDKCQHGFNSACLICGFSQIDGNKVWFDWVYQNQKVKVGELQDGEKTLLGRSKALQDNINELQRRMEWLEDRLKATDTLSKMRAAVIGSFNTQEFNSRTRRKMMILKQAEQALKGKTA